MCHGYFLPPLPRGFNRYTMFVQEPIPFAIERREKGYPYMNSKISLITLLSFMLYACASPKPPQGYNISKNEASLAEASYSVSRSLVDLAETAQANHPLPPLAPPPSPATYG